MLASHLHVPDHIDECLFIFRTNKSVFFFWITFWFWQGHIRTVKSFAFTAGGRAFQVVLATAASSGAAVCFAATVDGI